MVDVPRKKIIVSHGEPLRRETIERALERAGYPVATDRPDHQQVTGGSAATLKDPVCGMNVKPEKAAGRSEDAGRTC